MIETHNRLTCGFYKRYSIEGKWQGLLKVESAICRVRFRTNVLVKVMNSYMLLQHYGLNNTVDYGLKLETSSDIDLTFQWGVKHSIFIEWTQNFFGLPVGISYDTFLHILGK